MASRWPDALRGLQAPGTELGCEPSGGLFPSFSETETGPRLGGWVIPRTCTSIGHGDRRGTSESGCVLARAPCSDWRLVGGERRPAFGGLAVQYGKASRAKRWSVAETLLQGTVPG